jgi:hypothetical protein
MSIRTVYVKCESKKLLNEGLAQGKNFIGYEYDLGGSNDVNLRSLALGAVIKLFTKYVDGQPYAKAYGNVHYKKDGTISIK